MLVGMVDKMLETEAIVKEHPPLAGALKTSMSRILKLANKAADVGFHHEAIPSFEPLEDARPSEDHIEASTSSSLPALDDVYGSNNHRDVPSEDPNTNFEFNQRWLPTTETADKSLQISPVLGHPNTYSTGLGLSASSLPFGYSWFDYAPPNFKQKKPILPTRPSATALDAFTSRLLRTALTRGYFALSGIAELPPGEAQRIFAGSLRVRSRDDLLSSIRWLLGPGKSHMYHASGATWGSFQNLLQSAGLGQDGTVYLSTVDVQTQLLDLGATMVDSDTIEFRRAPDLGPQYGFTSANNESMTASSDTEASEPLAFIDFFATHHPEPRENPSSKMRISVPILIASLVEIGVCVSRGPVYPRHQVWAAVESSAVTA